jgi:putative oxidoreductase
MSRIEPYTYALLRIMAGFLFLWHGTQKLLSYPAAPQQGMTQMVQYVAGPIELVGGILILIGLFTPWAAFLCSGLMAAAYWMQHGTQAFFPLLNRGELAALYCFVFLFISSRGSGIWSIDALLSGPPGRAFSSATSR